MKAAGWALGLHAFRKIYTRFGKGKEKECIARRWEQPFGHGYIDRGTNFYGIYKVYKESYILHL